LALILLAFSLSAQTPSAPQKKAPSNAPPPEAGDDVRGYNDTPQLPGQKWKVHDMDRPRPVKVAPAPYVNKAPPADAIVLFDGRAAAIYGVWPRPVIPSRPMGEWNVYDSFFEAPKFDGEKLLKPAYMTVVFNGVLVQNHKDCLGTTIWRRVGTYAAHPSEQPL